MRVVFFRSIDADQLQEAREVTREVGVDVEFVNASSEEEALEAIRTADALRGRITPEMLDVAERLRWVQTTGADLARYMFPALAESKVTLTNARGIYSDVIADHVLGFIICFARGLHTYIRRQMAHNWQRGTPIIHLADQTVGIIGLGGIGIELARRCAACGMRVVAVDPRRTEKTEGVAALWDTDHLDHLLATSNFVVIAAPHTPETERMIGEAQFRRMKPTAHLINVSRGIIVDLAALTAALQDGIIAGAALDVFEIEPLPSDHPLWAMENVIITPHRAGTSAKTPRRRWEVFLRNLSHFLADEPLENVADKEKWY